VSPDDPTVYVVAEEVRSLAFQYFDGTNWQDTWDSTATGSDGMTPMGPPLAIAITVGLSPPGSTDASKVQTYRHVVALMTANGAGQQTTGTATSP
jgi:hypothetical protein